MPVIEFNRVSGGVGKEIITEEVVRGINNGLIVKGEPIAQIALAEELHLAYVVLIGARQRLVDERIDSNMPLNEKEEFAVTNQEVAENVHARLRDIVSLEAACEVFERLWAGEIRTLTSRGVIGRDIRIFAVTQ